jgi:hypothetical protein
MASPRRIFTVYQLLAQDAELVADFLVAKGDPVPGTVKLLCKRDAGKLLAKWGDEMEEVAGVLEGSHEDPYILEATQTFYWASLFAVVRGADWPAIGFDDGRLLVPSSGISTIDELRAAVQRLVAMGPEAAPPAKLFLLWNAADAIYRRITPADEQFSIEQIMQADLAEMQKRPYLDPILKKTAGL